MSTVNISSNSVNEFVFVMVMCCVFFEEQNDFLMIFSQASDLNG
jgi:hypothetical protein